MRRCNYYPELDRSVRNGQTEVHRFSIYFAEEAYLYLDIPIHLFNYVDIMIISWTTKPD